MINNNNNTNNIKTLCIIIIGVVLWVSLALLEEHRGDSMAKLSHSSKRERDSERVSEGGGERGL